MRKSHHGYASITHVATAYEGVVYSMPRPARHSDIWVNLHKIHETVILKNEKRGFLDSNGEWLTREGAFYRAQLTGQIKISSEWKENHPGKLKAGILYSEDLW